MAQGSVLGEKLAVNRSREERVMAARVLIVDDDPVMHSRRTGYYGMPCGGRRRSCTETRVLP
jgi:hypothetical protein